MRKPPDTVTDATLYSTPLPPMIARLALRFLVHKKWMVLSFVFVYAIGLSLYLVTDSLARNFRADIAEKSKEILEGEMRILTRRAFTEKEMRSIDSILPSGTETAEVWGFLSMLRVGDATRLVQVKAISSRYPLMGRFTFKGDALTGDLKSGETFFPPELMPVLKTRVGDKVRLGESDFSIRDEYLEKPGSSIQLMEMGSRIYIPLADVPATGLDRKGSRIFRYRFHVFPSGTDLTHIKKELEKVLTDPEIEITLHSDADGELGRSFNLATAFLQMVSLSAFLLSALGGAFFFHHHLVGERRNIALLSILGLKRDKVVRLYLFQNILLALGASHTAIALGLGLSYLLPVLIRGLFDVDIASGLPLVSMAKVVVLAVVTSLIFCASGFFWIRKLSPATLIKPVDSASGGLGPWIRWGIYIVTVLYFYLLALATSRSWILSGLFVGSMGTSFGLLAGLGVILFQVFSRMRRRFGYQVRIILGFFRWSREKSLMAFASLGLVAFSSSLLPQLQSVLINEISVPRGQVVPQLFLFDIQEEQLEPLVKLLGENGVTLDKPAPMVRARLERVNGSEFKKDLAAKATLEEKNRQRFRNRGFNLSYRDTLSDAESLLEGVLWTGGLVEDADPEQPAEISLEEAFAERLELKLGDVLLFDVQGVPVKGLVTSLRKVRWTSFQPNFFVLFQPGALDLAPKTFLGTIRELPSQETEAVQGKVVEAFPNITVLNLKEMILKSVQVLSKLQWLVTFLSGFALLVGLAMLGLIVHSIVSDSQRNLLLLRTLGANRRALTKLFLKQYIGFCLAAGMAGYFLSLAGVWIINRMVWKLPWTVNPMVFWICLGASLLTGLVCAVYAIIRTRRGSLKQVLSLTRL